MTQPILLFDSGVGGLSVLRAVRERLPDAPVVYAADNGGYPYGTKTEMEVATRVCALLGRLTERYRPQLVVIACNTASTIALAHVRGALEVPIVGTVPAIKPAAAATRTKVIGVLGTQATVRQPYVDRLSQDFAADCVVLRHGSSRLVELAEAELRGRPGSHADYAAALAGLLDQPDGDRMDTVVLACTHFPLVEERLAEAAPRPLTFVDGAAGIARRTAHLLADVGWVGPATGRALFTARGGDVDALRPALAGFGLTEIDYL
jgi:glutamate racemase